MTPMLCTWMWILLLGALATVGPCLADERPPLDQVEAMLADVPPRIGGGEDRVPIYRALDAWAQAPNTVYWDQRPEVAHPGFARFYVRRIQHALAAIPNTPVTRGAVVWKMYSSGFVVKTPDAVFAFDVVEGPYKNIDREPVEESCGGFHWTPAMRRGFARTTDALFITHFHYDHCSYALARAMVEAGKTVVVPRQLRDHWANTPFASGLTVLPPGEDRVLGPLTVRVFDGVQYMQQDDQREWVTGDHDAQNNVYLVRDRAGTTFLHNGDNRGRSFVPWLREAVRDGWTVTVWFRIMHWPRSLVDDVESIAHPIIIAGHEHELGHKPKFGVNLLMNLYNGLRGKPGVKDRLAVLVWGESLAIAPESAGSRS